jgi:Flp pilus assembly protein TadD
MLPILRPAFEALRNHDLKTALASASLAAVMMPCDPEPLVVMAAATLETGDKDGALLYVDRALGLDKEHPLAQQIRGNIMLATGRAAAAETAFSTALRRQPRNAAALHGLAVAYQQQKHFARAIARIEDTCSSALPMRRRFAIWGRRWPILGASTSRAKPTGRVFWSTRISVAPG